MRGDEKTGGDRPRRLATAETREALLPHFWHTPSPPLLPSPPLVLLLILFLMSRPDRHVPLFPPLFPQRGEEGIEHQVYATATPLQQ